MVTLWILPASFLLNATTTSLLYCLDALFVNRLQFQPMEELWLSTCEQQVTITWATQSWKTQNAVS